MEFKGRRYSFWKVVEEWKVFCWSSCFCDDASGLCQVLKERHDCFCKSQKILRVYDTGEFNGRRSVILACSLGSAWTHTHPPSQGSRDTQENWSEMRGVDKAWRPLQFHSLLVGNDTAVTEEGRWFSWEHKTVYQLSRKRNSRGPAACVYRTASQLYSDTVIKAVWAIIVMLVLFSSLLPILHYKNYIFHIIRSVSYLIILLYV